MNFISTQYLVLFAIVLVLYFRLPHRGQNLLLLAASYVFYGWWDWRLLGLIVFSTTVAYFGALAMDRTRRPEISDRWRRAALIASVGANLGVLGFFKYFNFFVDSMVGLGQALGLQLHASTLQIILPVGISFYTFQTISYVVDIYRGQLRATGRFLDLALYVSLFTQLVAGPIERGRHLLPQISAPRTPTWDKFCSGAQLALFGVFKKMVIADNLALIVNGILLNPLLAKNGVGVMVAAWAFAFQIYCDFSGYTDIARGCARMLGFDIMVNFRLPYLATNPRDFWRRWHISLSTWLRDYLYIPLGGNRHGRWKTFRNVIITFVLGGLWHGASWNFVLWGGYHAALMVGFDLVIDRRKSREVSGRTRRGLVFWLKVALFFQLVSLGWLVFRIENMSALLAALGAAFTPDLGAFVSNTRLVLALAGLVALAGPLMCFEIYRYRRGPEPWTVWRTPARAVFYLVQFYGIILLGAPEARQFIYFQF